MTIGGDKATSRVMHQSAPWPAVLAELVGKLRYKPGWTFRLSDMDRGQGSEGLTLVIHRVGPDAYNPEETLPVNHYMLVPPAAFDVRSWQRWLLDQILLVERHEAMEFFTIVHQGDFVKSDGTRTTEIRVKPYAPNHGPGNDPYIIPEYRDDIDRRTSFTGAVNP